MSIDQITPQALGLPARERALLAASLWESLEDPYALAAGRDEEESISLALARDEELEAGSVLPLSHDALMRRLRK